MLPWLRRSLDSCTTGENPHGRDIIAHYCHLAGETKHDRLLALMQWSCSILDGERPPISVVQGSYSAYEAPQPHDTDGASDNDGMCLALYERSGASDPNIGLLTFQMVSN